MGYIMTTTDKRKTMAVFCKKSVIFCGLFLIWNVSCQDVCQNAKILKNDACVACPKGFGTPSGFFVLESINGTHNTQQFPKLPVPDEWQSSSYEFANMFPDAGNFQANPRSILAFIAINASNASVQMQMEPNSSLKVEFFAHSHDQKAKTEHFFSGTVLSMQGHEKIIVHIADNSNIEISWKFVKHETECVPCAEGYYRINTAERYCRPCAPRTKWVSGQEPCLNCGNANNSAQKFASTTCVPCAPHRLYRDTEQAFEPGCPWCPQDTVRNSDSMQCQICAEGLGRKERESHGCYPKYVNQDRCAVVNQSEIHTKHRTNCSCSTLEYVTYVNITKNTAYCSNITTHDSWKAAQFSTSDPSILCTIRACGHQDFCDEEKLGSAFRWTGDAINYADLYESPSSSTLSYLERPTWIQGHLHVSMQCPIRDCETPVNVITALQTTFSSDSVLIAQGVVFEPYTTSPAFTREECKLKCFKLGNACQWYAWQSTVCFYDTNTHLQFNIDFEQCRDTASTTAYFENHLNLQKGKDFSDLDYNHTQIPLYYRQYFNHRTYSKFWRTSLRLPAKTRRIYGTIEDQTMICIEICYRISTCGYVGVKHDSNETGTCAYGTQFVEENYNQTTEYTNFDLYSFMSPRQVCVDSDRFYHKSSEVFACPQNMVVDRETGQCVPCSKGFAKNSAPECFLDTYDDGSCQECKACPVFEVDGICRSCNNIDRVVDKLSSSCTACPENYLQCHLSEYQCCPCGKGQEVVIDGKHGSCQACSGRYAGNPLSITGCVECPLEARIENMCKCPPGFFVLPNGECEPCPQGTFSDSYGVERCTECSPGTVATMQQSTRCLPCLKNRGPNFTTAISCLPPMCTNDDESTACAKIAVDGFCNAGSEAVQVVPGQSLACVPCAQGSYKAIASTEPCLPCVEAPPGAQTCPKNDHINDQHVVMSKIQDIVELYSAPDFLVPKQIDTKICPLTGQTLSNLCACSPGSYLDTQHNTCLKCPHGTDTTSYNASVCLPCELPFVYDLEKGRCVLDHTMCTDGLQHQNLNHQSCVCPPGQFSSENQCVLCEPGKFKPQAGNASSECRWCHRREISIEDRSACKMCDSNQVRADNNIDCMCDRGYTKKYGICRACNKGSFKEDYGDHECTRCPPGFFTATFAQTQCEPCDATSDYDPYLCGCKPGTNNMFYSPFFLRGFCTNCATGKYKSLWGNQECSLCNNNTEGKRIYSEGRTSCHECYDGKHISETDVAGEGCTNCTAADYELLSGSNYCSIGVEPLTGFRRHPRCPTDTPNLIHNTCQRCAINQDLGWPLVMKSALPGIDDFDHEIQQYDSPYYLKNTDSYLNPYGAKLYKVDASARGTWQVNGISDSFFLRSRESHEYFVFGRNYTFDLFKNESGNYSILHENYKYLFFEVEQCQPCGENSTYKVSGWKNYADGDFDPFSSNFADVATYLATNVMQPGVFPSTFTVSPTLTCTNHAICPPGYEIDNATQQCLACTSGKTSYDGNKCSVCKRGYQPKHGFENECRECPIGFFKNLAGNHDCETSVSTFFYNDSILDISWSPDSSKLVFCSHDGTVHKLDTSTGNYLFTIKGDGYGMSSVSLSPDGTKIATGFWNNMLRIWGATTGELLSTLTGHTDAVISLAWSLDSSRLASGSQDESVRIWDVGTGTCESILSNHESSVMSVSWSPDGQKIVSAANQFIRIWDRITGNLIFTLNEHGPSLTTVSWNPNTHKIVSAATDRTVQIWDAENGTNLLTLLGHTSIVSHVCWSPDGTKIASVSSDQTLRIWDESTGKELSTLIGHTHRIFSVSWSPDGTRLASGGGDNTIRVWDIYIDSVHNNHH